MECDSKLAANMHGYFDGRLYLGSELRTFYVLAPTVAGGWNSALKRSGRGAGKSGNGGDGEYHLLAGFRLAAEWAINDR